MNSSLRWGMVVIRDKQLQVVYHDGSEEKSIAFESQRSGCELSLR